ncbi:MAG TPA: ATP-binding cassette domain-containing protein [Candidatus Saccharimonadales bacterium]|nr:ATP-binding cassette domain-containing protein [Candidatus Saccharimonadales bacterium]
MDTVIVKNLVKKYGDFAAVDDVSFSVKKGEIFGLLGPNGAGKTTTIKVLTTLTAPTSGRATVNGHDTVREPLLVKGGIGWVASEVLLDDDLQVIENLKLQASLQGIYGWEDNAVKMLEYFGIKETYNKKVGTLSTGMRKKLEIIMALISEPSVIFMDEPTIGLDVGTRKMLWELIRDIRKRHGVTIFLTTHYMEEADELCDRIAIISKGKIVAMGTPEKLKSRAGGGIATIEVGEDFMTGSLKGLKFDRKGNTINIHLKGGESEFASALRQIDMRKVRSLKLVKPSLDSVFLKLTGSTLEEQEASGKFDTVKFYATVQRSKR